MKKLFLTAALFLSLSGATYAAPDQGIDSSVRTTTVESVDYSATEIELAPPASAEIESVSEDNTMKKMSQKEIAHNAAVNDPWGGVITIIAMVIVIAALVILSILFLCFGKVSEYFLAKKKRQSVKAAAASEDKKRLDVDSGDVIAAIAMALSEHFGEGHDMEETILTIRRMKKAYSHWSSKIYNLRSFPNVEKNTPSRSAF